MNLQDSWHVLRGLPVHVTGISVRGLKSHPASPWIRKTTEVLLRGPGDTAGVGEDVNYTPAEQEALQPHGLPEPVRLALLGEYSLGELGHRLDAVDCGPDLPRQPAARLYRRWALESAVLDLALQQGGTHLGQVLGREAAPLRFVTSLNLKEPDARELHQIRGRCPGIGFKLDWSERWPTDPDAPFLRELRELGGIAVIDLKGHYTGAFQGPPPVSAGYGAVARALPEALLEDPVWNGAYGEALAPHLDRVAFDAPLHSRGDFEQQPVRTRWANSKPSRFGRLEEFFGFLDLCANRGIQLYGGGQYELGTGRSQIQELASLFHPEGPNDVAPVAFHQWQEAESLPAGPLSPAGSGTGFPRRDPAGSP